MTSKRQTQQPNEEKSKQLCDFLKKEFGSDCSYLLADFSKLSDTHRVAKQLAALDRDIDVLIHNAGVFLTKKTISDK